MYPIKRIGQDVYLGKFDEEKPIKIHCAVKLPKSAAYYIAQKALKQIERHEGKETLRFRFGGKKWKVVPVNHDSLLKRILRFFNLIHMPLCEGRFTRYKVEAAWFCFKPQKNVVKRTLQGHLLSKLKVPVKDFEKGVRHQVQSDGLLHSFTTLATAGIQMHESLYVPKDSTGFSRLEHRIILREGKLQLVREGSPLCTKEALSAASQMWKQCIIDEFGERKWDEIKDFYQLDTTRGLTSEHVYRANIGVMNIELDDLKDFAERWVSDGRLTAREKSRIETWPEGKEILTQAWCDVSKLTPEQFHRLYSLLAFTDAEKENHYTGRTIYYPISSSYTIGGKKAYKPWIDQHELVQEFSLLIHAPSWEAYQEQLAHVVVKKHLLRVPPNGQPRLGALIPAPPAEPGGPIRYYTVVGCISNGATLSYILQSSIQDPTLPLIKLYRSTSTNPYAINAMDTIVNDLNHFNSPGYLGIKDLDNYEKEFLKKYTMPVWLGYVDASKSAENPALYLKNASESLKQSFMETIRSPSFSQILRKHDKPLNALFFPYRSRNIRQFLQDRKGDVIRNLIERFIHADILQSEEEVKKGAFGLISYLRKAQVEHKEDQSLFHQIDDLCDEITKKILFPIKQELDTAKKKLLSDLEMAEKACLNAKGEEERKERERAWAAIFEEYALAQGENREEKVETDLQFSGHSLGGACAAIAMARYLAKEDRMPLPGKKCEGFFFDDPGINEEDNQAFLRYGDRNAALFDQLKVRFRLFRRHEAKDFVPTSGEVGLGSVEKKNEMEKLKQWCDYDCAVHFPLKTAVHREVAESKAIHGTRYLHGKLGVDYQARKVTPYEEGLFRMGNAKRLLPEEMKEHQFLYRKVWQLSGTFEKFFKERVRQSFSLPLQFIRYSLIGGRGQAPHVLPQSQVDSNGCFSFTLDRNIRLNSQFKGAGSFIKQQPKMASKN